MEKSEIVAVLTALDVPFKRSLGKEKLLEELAANVRFETNDLRVAARSRGLDANLDRAGLLGALGVVTVEKDGEVMVGLAEPEAVKHKGKNVDVICIVENVHLGDGRILRMKDRASLPGELADLLIANDQVVSV